MGSGHQDSGIPRQDVFIPTKVWNKDQRHDRGTESRQCGLIAVFNFTTQYLDPLVNATGVEPALNQEELDPFFQQAELRELMKT